MTEKKENKLIAFIKSYHTENFKWNDFFIIPLLIALVLFEVGALIAGNVLSLILYNVVDSQDFDYFYFLTNYLMFTGVWLIFLLYFLIKSNRPLYGAIWKKCKGNTLKNLGLGLLIGFGTNSLCILIAALHKDIHLYFEGANIIKLLVLFIAVFIQSSAEELMCRGFIYQRLRRGYRHPAVAIIGNASLFAFLHIFNPGVNALAIINILLVGISYSLFVYYCDSIWIPMAAHAAWNYTQNIIFGLPNSGIVSKFSIIKLDATTATDSFAYNVGFGVESTIVAAIVLTLCCVLTIYWGEKNKKHPTNIWEKADK